MLTTKYKKSYKSFYYWILLICGIFSISSLSVAEEENKFVHGIALHGEPKYPAKFTHFEYTNPKALKGGSITLNSLGQFDTFNPYIPKGTPTDGMEEVYETLMTPSRDEPFSVYGLIAEGVYVNENHNEVTFKINSQARFSDGHPIDSEDVVFSFNFLTTKGKPLYSLYYKDVSSVKALDKQHVRFTVNPEARELPLILGELPILPSHVGKLYDFNKADLTIPIGSGAYRVKKFLAGKRVIFEKRQDYWGKDLPVNRGRHNFNEIRYDYYLDSTVAMQAFKAGEYDLRNENNSKFWATSYTGPAFTRGDIVREEIAHDIPVGMQGFVLNLRRPIFEDPLLRRAIVLAFDFEWSNKNLFYGQYQRTQSYFQNTELTATGAPSIEELALLEPFRKQLPAEVFQPIKTLPKHDGSGRIRGLLRDLQKDLRIAGYQVKNNQLYSPKGKAIEFEFLLYESAFERIILPYSKNLKLLGITMKPRKVDTTQYIERLRQFDFDMVVTTYGQTLSPGNEQRSYWSSESATQNDSRNFMGLQNPVVDSIVEKLVQSPDRPQLIQRARALDRVLRAGYYIVPNYHVSYHRLAYQKRIQRPKVMPKYGLDFMAWWDNAAASK
ncbi:MAG: extracellular solute-binding protein [Pseudomonadota bacterium]